MMHFETLCYPDFNTEIFIEIKFLVHGIKSSKFIPDKDGWSVIGNNLLKINNPFKTMVEYVEVVFDEFICSVLSMGI